MKKVSPDTVTIYDELTAETSKGSSKWKTWLKKADASEMPRGDAQNIIYYALQGWANIAPLRDLSNLPDAVKEAHSLEPANSLEIMLHSLVKWKAATAILVPKIQGYFEGRDALTVRLATRPKDESESDYDIQAELVPKLPRLTDDQVTKRRQRLERAKQKNDNE
jgi:hypothetical protein